MCEPAPGLRWAWIYASDASFASLPGGRPGISSPAGAELRSRSVCLTSSPPLPGSPCECMPGTRRKPAPRPQVTLHVPVLLTATPSHPQGLLIPLLERSQSDYFSQTLSSLLVSWMTVKGQVVFHFCPRIPSAHFLVLTREISEKCRSENMVSLSPSPPSEAQDDNRGP